MAEFILISDFYKFLLIVSAMVTKMKNSTLSEEKLAGLRNKNQSQNISKSKKPACTYPNESAAGEEKKFEYIPRPEMEAIVCLFFFAEIRNKRQ